MSKQRTGILVLVVLALVGTAADVPRETVAAGYWTNAATWAGGVLPTAGDDVLLKHAVTLDHSTPALNSFTNSATLTFTGWETKLSATHIFVNGTNRLIINIKNPCRHHDDTGK